MSKRLPADVWWHPQKRCLVRAHVSLVRAAQDSTYGNSWSDKKSVDAQRFILAAGGEIYLLAGLLGLGIGYLIASKHRCPHYGQPTKVFPYGGRAYEGPWNGIDGHGTMHIGDREFDPDHLRMAGPVRTIREDGRKVIDLRNGFVNPDELIRLRKAHNRDGFRRRKGQNHGHRLG